jgi:UDP-N-acetylglucosamine 2-epimerase (non-hydrolysing)
MKVAPLLRALSDERRAQQAAVTLIHTGQHYDANLSDVFFAELEMRRPDVSLEVGSASHGVQTARVIEGMEQTLQKGTANGKFDRLVVVGDVNSTMAASIAASKLNIPVAHIEAGLRSFDRSMPEEINRLVTDAIADLLLVSEPAGMDHLRREGHHEDELHLVGNVMIDTIFQMLPKAKRLEKPESLGLKENGYGVVTLHRPSNVDDPQVLRGLVDVLVEISSEIPLVFPIHPRTSQRVDTLELSERIEAAQNLHLLPPLGYLEFLSLTSQAKFIISDSGGLQEESTALGIPCLTMRANTERPITVDVGTSTLIGSDTDKLRFHLREILAGRYKTGRCPELWDGHAAERIADILIAAD